MHISTETLLARIKI